MAGQARVFLLEKSANPSTRFNSSRGLETKVPPIERAEMRGAETYEQYATECERIARTMSGEQRKSLMAIAEAWRELAREAGPQTT